MSLLCDITITVILIRMRVNIQHFFENPFEKDEPSYILNIRSERVVSYVLSKTWLSFIVKYDALIITEDFFVKLIINHMVYY